MLYRIFYCVNIYYSIESYSDTISWDCCIAETITRGHFSSRKIPEFREEIATQAKYSLHQKETPGLLGNNSGNSCP